MQRISKNALMHQSTITYNIINIDSIWQWHTIIATIVLVIASTEIGTLWRTGQLHNEKELGLFTHRNPALGWISREERLVARGSWLPRKTHHHSGSWPSLFWWHEERVSLRAWPVCCAAWSHCKQIQKRKHHIASKYDSMVLFRSKSACDGLQFFHCQGRALLWRKEQILYILAVRRRHGLQTVDTNTWQWLEVAQNQRFQSCSTVFCSWCCNPCHMDSPSISAVFLYCVHIWGCKLSLVAWQRNRVDHLRPASFAVQKCCDCCAPADSWHLKSVKILYHDTMICHDTLRRTNVERKKCLFVVFFATLVLGQRLRRTHFLKWYVSSAPLFLLRSFPFVLSANLP